MHSQNVVDFVNDPLEVEVALETGEATGNDVLGGGRLLSLELNPGPVTNSILFF